MNRGNATVASLLAVVAVLLGMNLMATKAPAAPAGVNGACCLLNGSCQVMGPATCATLNGAYQGDGVTCDAVNCSSPTIVAGAAYLSGNGHQLWRFWSNGAVDSITVDSLSCAFGNVCVLPILPGPCAADVTRNGEVEVGDFLAVLGQWGPCQ